MTGQWTKTAFARWMAACALAAALATGGGAWWTTHAQEAATTHNVSLRGEQVSKGADGRLVITASVDGDLRGALTLTVTGTAADGTITSGEWALVNTYVQDLYGPGHSANDGDTEDTPGHDAGQQLVDNGTIGGAISSGTLTFDGNGQLAAVGSVQLAVASGTLTFSGVKAGSATLTLSNVQDPSISSGAAAFVF